MCLLPSRTLCISAPTFVLIFCSLCPSSFRFSALAPRPSIHAVVLLRIPIPAPVHPIRTPLTASSSRPTAPVQPHPCATSFSTQPQPHAQSAFNPVVLALQWVPPQTSAAAAGLNLYRHACRQVSAAAAPLPLKLPPAQGSPAPPPNQQQHQGPGPLSTGLLKELRPPQPTPSIPLGPSHPRPLRQPQTAHSH